MASIGATPRKPVAKTVKVRYTLGEYARGQTADAYDANAHNWRWYIAYHWYDQTGEEPEGWAKEKDDEGNSTQRLFFVKKWTKVGRHRVSCVGRGRTGKKEVLDFAEYEQQVEERGTFLARQMARSKKSFKLPNPHAELAMTWKWLTLLDAISKVNGALPTKELKEQHQKQVKDLETYAQKLKDLLAQCDEDVIWPFRAVYLAEESMEEVDLRVFLTRPKGKKNQVMIVDWTNLNEPKMYGTYVGKFPKWEGRTTAQMISVAFKDAIDTWQDDNKYWVGGIRYEFDVTLDGGSKVSESGDIKTGEKGFTETLTEYLKKIALGAAMIGLILTGVGSAWAGAFIVTAMVASTTGSVLSIHTRHSKGSGNFIDDAMDVLDIVGNVLGVAGKAGKAILWRKGATLELTQAGKTVQALFIGEVLADGFNGMLLGVDFIKKYDEIMSAHLTPDERARRLVALFGSAASAGVLIGLNNRVTSSIEQAKWKRLSEPTPDGKPLRFDDKTTTIKGNSNEGGKNTTVVTSQKRQEPSKVDGTPKTKPFPPKDDKIWRLNQVDDRSINLETKDGFKFSAGLDHRNYVGIDIKTRKTAAEAKTDGTGETSSHLGSGQENFDRMFHHFESNGHEIKGWAGMFTDDNFKAVKAALDGGASAKDAIFKSITGEKFWVPWMKSKGIKPHVEIATPAGEVFMFSVRFDK